jgi:peroxisomal membrane protein 4
MLLQRKLNGGKGRPHDSFFAGLLGGYLVFGERNAINEQVSTVLSVPHPPLLCVHTRGFLTIVRQIVLYVCSRVIASFIPRAGSPHVPVTTGGGTVKPIPPNSRYFSIFAAISWGAVMWLFQHRGETIQPGMFNSMTYLYRDSERWQNLRTLLWHNK